MNTVSRPLDFYRETDFNLSVPDRIKAYLSSIVADHTYGGFEKSLLSQISLHSVNLDTRQTRFTFIVEEWMCNKDGNLHGGAISTIFDNLSSTSLFTVGKPGSWDNLGLSRSLAVTYHRTLPKNMEVLVRCEVLAAGRRMATVRATMEDDRGKIFASCVHEKFALPSSRL